MLRLVAFLAAVFAIAGAGVLVAGLSSGAAGAGGADCQIVDVAPDPAYGLSQARALRLCNR